MKWKDDNCRVISFYSYKGGAGRSLSALNVVAMLAEKMKPTADEPLLVIDMDLDSSGITFLTNSDTRIKKSKLSIGSVLDNSIDFMNNKQVGLIKAFFREEKRKLSEDTLSRLKSAGVSSERIDLIKGFLFDSSIVNFFEKDFFSDSTTLSRNVDMVNSTKSINELLNRIEMRIDAYTLIDISYVVGYEDPGSILFLGANPDGHVTYNLESADYFNALEMFIAECKRRNFKAIIIDSASGRQTISEIVRDLSDFIVICMRVTNQFLTGTFNYLHLIANKEKVKGKKIILLPVAVPENNPLKLRAAIMSIKSSYNKLIQGTDNCIYEKDLILDFIDNGIPEVDSFKWEESILKVKQKEKELAEDEKRAFIQYGTVRDCLVRLCNESD